MDDGVNGFVCIQVLNRLHHWDLLVITVSHQQIHLLVSTEQGEKCGHMAYGTHGAAALIANTLLTSTVVMLARSFAHQILLQITKLL